MRNLLHIFIIIAIFIGPAYADQYTITGYVEVDKEQDIKSFFKEKIELTDDLITPELLKRTEELNPEIKDFERLSPGTFVFVEIPQGDGIKKILFVQPSDPAPIEVVKETPKEIPTETPKDNIPWNLSTFYMISSGTFTEKGEGVEVESKQDSPITLGLAGIKTLGPRKFFAGSIYLSHLDASLSNTDVKNDIPPEYGITAHLNWDKEKWPVVLYTGLEFERFSTFNVDEIANSEDISVRNHHILYLVGGVSQKFEAFNRSYFFKGSIGKSLSSTADDGGTPFEGIKYILFLNTPLKGKWGIQAFIKQHFLSGPSDLTVTRIGLGVSYTLF